MRVLLDENVDRRLKRAFDEQHEVTTVPERGWAGLKNGELLEAASIQNQRKAPKHWFGAFFVLPSAIEVQRP